MERTYDIIYQDIAYCDIHLEHNVGQSKLEDTVYRLKVCGNAIVAIYPTDENLVDKI